MDVVVSLPTLRIFEILFLTVLSFFRYFKKRPEKIHSDFFQALIYPTLTGSPPPPHNFRVYKEDRWGCVARMRPISGR